ncbi:MULTISPECIES: ABC transporter permease [Crateriforma]|uniref:Iron export permease protein FetB n=1 Tax=Crateriforma conspicua TaxID=2527996 RepID=A0A5C6FLL0_9PLAN|nr:MULTISPECIES: iron export ABC transporter permease subunit FetB [Crateriforma]TWU60994.1 hypothetical protein V7x_53050 [Crateriforma conspicua]
MTGLFLLSDATSTAPTLDWWQVAIAALLLAVNGLISWWLRLKLERKILIGAVRLCVQLGLLGLILHQIFSLTHLLPVLALASAMTVIAGVSAVGRVTDRFRGIYPTAIFSVWASSWLITAITVLLIVRPQPWFSPAVLIPLLGMVLGNSLTGISLGMDRFLSELNHRRDEIEMRLALGADRYEATQAVMAHATGASMIPILNTMSVAGIVSIPGMMTGQLLAGAPPLQAVAYQITIMFVIASTIALGVITALSLTVRRLTTPWHQIDWHARKSATSARRRSKS